MPALAGEIVYSGNGIRGYRNLIIIKHNSHYLSAYAYNQTMLVKLGQQVANRRPIATMGRDDAGQVMLHFEIRYDGRPVDPMRFLAKLTFFRRNIMAGEVKSKVKSSQTRNHRWTR